MRVVPRAGGVRHRWTASLEGPKDLLFWDGRAEGLEAQASGPLFAPDEMGQTETGLLDHVGANWSAAFEQAFPGEDGPALQQVTVALAAYERTLPRRSRFDDFLDGERDALTKHERRGYRLFRRNCTGCHDGPGLGGERFEKLGDKVPWPEDRRDDPGRHAVTEHPRDVMVFLVPGLRNLAQTGPWFHDGSVETLEKVALGAVARVRRGLGPTPSPGSCGNYPDRRLLPNLLELCRVSSATRGARSSSSSCFDHSRNEALAVGLGDASRARS